MFLFVEIEERPALKFRLAQFTPFTLPVQAYQPEYGWRPKSLFLQVKT
jgi:hypothetical protein